MIRIFAIDDHKMLIDSFTEHFNANPDIQIVDYALTGTEAIQRLKPATREFKPDIILLDIGLNDMNGIDCAKQLLANDPTLKIICLSTYMQTSIVKKMMKTGARAYISKSTDIQQLEQAIRKVLEGEIFIGSTIQVNMMNEIVAPKKVSRDIIVPQITQREKEVLEQIAAELSTKEIAEQLFISVNTVETHRKNLLSKFNVKNAVGLVRKAMELGLID
ncbi:MAG: response regulator transcription factor [Bacteroidota bacterium]